MILDEISAVEAVAVTLPLPAPVQLGATELRQREYALVRVTTAAGLVGSAYCLNRGAPIVEAVNGLLAPVLRGNDADAIEARWEQSYRATIMSGRSGLVMRALGLVDIALWDIKAQRASMPLWRLLGGHDAAVPALLVAGYLAGETRPEALVDQLLGYAKQGHRLIKIARIANRELMNGLIAEVAARAGAEVAFVVDAGFGWSTVADALAESGDWALPLAWLEDPFPPERIEAYRQLRGRCRHPLAAADEAAAPATRALLVAGLIDFLRLDIPAVGGITPALRLMVEAAAAEVPVSFHIYPEVSVHLAAARAQPSIVESFDTSIAGGNPFDPAHLLTGISLPMVDGRIHASEDAGLGFTLAWPGES